jgi:hypothetical protein
MKISIILTFSMYIMCSNLKFVRSYISRVVGSKYYQIRLNGVQKNNIPKNEEEWKNILTPNEFAVLRKQATG